MLLTSLASEEKYKSKSFIDTAVYRGGDALGAWFSQALAPATLLPAALFLCTLWR
jgi:ATP:ADP antiporter, AAA family